MSQLRKISSEGDEPSIERRKFIYEDHESFDWTGTTLLHSLKDSTNLLLESCEEQEEQITSLSEQYEWTLTMCQDQLKTQDKNQLLLQQADESLQRQKAIVEMFEARVSELEEEKKSSVDHGTFDKLDREKRQLEVDLDHERRRVEVISKQLRISEERMNWSEKKATESIDSQRKMENDHEKLVAMLHEAQSAIAMQKELFNTELKDIAQDD